MTVSNFNLESKGATDLPLSAHSMEIHEFTYVMADHDQASFHAFFDEKETWINHRDDGKCLNVDPCIAAKFMNVNKTPEA
jgi:hypothetical protein